MEEIKENDFNLNIPRYVDTFEEEVAVDLDDVSAQLKALDIDMKDTDGGRINLNARLKYDGKEILFRDIR